MKLEIVIVLITSATSFVVAIIGLAAAILSNIQSKRSEKELEMIRFQLDIQKTSFSLRKNELEKRIKSLNSLISSIQKFKDCLQVILHESSLDNEYILKSIIKVRLELFRCYEDEMPYLTKEELKASHSAKNLALTIEQEITKLLKKKLKGSFSDKNRSSLLELRNQLTDCQNLLRDTRTEAFIIENKP